MEGNSFLSVFAHRLEALETLQLAMAEATTTTTTMTMTFSELCARHLPADFNPRSRMMRVPPLPTVSVSISSVLVHSVDIKSMMIYSDEEDEETSDYCISESESSILLSAPEMLMLSQTSGCDTALFAIIASDEEKKEEKKEEEEMVNYGDIRDIMVLVDDMMDQNEPTTVKTLTTTVLKWLRGE